MFMRELQLSFSHNLVAVVKENQSDQVAGFITFWIIANEFQLHNIAVRWHFRRKGIATRLFLAMIQEAWIKVLIQAHLKSETRMKRPEKMYEKFGCRVTTVRSSYYSETKENALIMAVKLKGVLRSCIMNKKRALWIGKILSNREMMKGYLLMSVRLPRTFDAPLPGQFVMIHLRDRKDILLGRPFSIYGIQYNKAE